MKQAFQRSVIGTITVFADVRNSVNQLGELTRWDSKLKCFDSKLDTRYITVCDMFLQRFDFWDRASLELPSHHDHLLSSTQWHSIIFGEFCWRMQISFPTWRAVSAVLWWKKTVAYFAILCRLELDSVLHTPQIGTHWSCFVWHVDTNQSINQSRWVARYEHSSWCRRRTPQTRALTHSCAGLNQLAVH